MVLWMGGEEEGVWLVWRVLSRCFICPSMLGISPITDLGMDTIDFQATKMPRVLHSFAAQSTAGNSKFYCKGISILEFEQGDVIVIWDCL